MGHRIVLELVVVSIGTATIHTYSLVNAWCTKQATSQAEVGGRCPRGACVCASARPSQGRKPWPEEKTTTIASTTQSLYKTIDSIISIKTC